MRTIFGLRVPKSRLSAACTFLATGCARPGLQRLPCSWRPATPCSDLFSRRKGTRRQQFVGRRGVYFERERWAQRHAEVGWRHLGISFHKGYDSGSFAPRNVDVRTDGRTRGQIGGHLRQVSISATSWRQSRVLQLCRQHVNANCSNCRWDGVAKEEEGERESGGRKLKGRSCVQGARRGKLKSRTWSRRAVELMVNKYENFIDLRNTIWQDLSNESCEFKMHTHIIIASTVVSRVWVSRCARLTCLANKLPGGK